MTQRVVVARDVQHPLLAQERVVLDLVGEHGRELERLLQQAGGEVRHADLPHAPVVPEPVQRAERLLQRHLRVRPVQQQQVDVVDAEPLERLLGVALDQLRRGVRVRHLRGQEDLVPRHAAVGDPAPDLALVLVRARGVDLAVSDLQRVPHAVRRIRPRDQPSPEPEGRNARALDLDRLVSVAHARSRIPLLRLATSRAISSAGRAPPRQGGGHWFEPSIAHLPEPASSAGSRRSRGRPR